MQKIILDNKIAIITGGTKGIGLGIAESLLEQGMRVVITGRNQNSLDHAIKNLTEKFGKDKVLGFTNDVVDLNELIKTVTKVNELWGEISVVIANAGVGHFSSIEDLTAEQWSETINTNLTGVFNTIKATLTDLKNTSGYFITISSLAGTNFFAQGAAYNASKFGVVGFSQAIMLDLRKYGIKVTTIMPGSVTSHFNGHVPSEDKDGWKIQPEDIGQMVVDLLNMHPRTLPSKIEVRPTTPK